MNMQAPRTALVGQASLSAVGQTFLSASSLRVRGVLASAEQTRTGSGSRNAPARQFDGRRERHRCPPHHRSGVTILELLIALSISALLLLATAVAVDASVRAYKNNQEQSSLIQRSRIAIDRLTTVIRTTKDHQPYSATAALGFKSGQVVTDIGVDLFDVNGVETDFHYDSPTQRILAVVGGKTYVLASGVTAFSIKLEPMRSPESVRTGGGWDLLQRATISLTVKTTGNTASASETTNTQSVTLSASVMPRQNTW